MPHCARVIAVIVLALLSRAEAAEMPSPAELTAQTGADPIVVRVYEPHLSVGDRLVAIDYLGYPAEEVLTAILGATWQGQGQLIEFRALDGYVSRLDATRFRPGRAWLVFARADGTAFTVDNLGQNELGVPLGPYYLVWNNRAEDELLAEGASAWPYQVAEISLFDGSDAALKPAGLTGDHGEAISLVKANCLSCHKINGYGGEKFAGNLALIAKEMDPVTFRDWILAPSALRPGTTMPPVAPRRSAATRERIAILIHAYLNAVPAVSD